MANAEYTVTTKDGAEFTITAPEGTPSEEISKRARAVIEGTAQSPTEAATPQGVLQGAGDVAKGFGIGAAKALEHAPGMMAGVMGLAGRGLERLGVGDPEEAKKREQLRAENKPFMLTGGLQAPENLQGQYGETAGEFLPMLAFGQGGAIPRIARWLFAAGGSETAGQIAKRAKVGDFGEGAARLAGALTPAVMELLWRRRPDRMLQVVNDLENAARQNYNNPAVRDLRIRTSHVQAEAMRIYDDLYQEGMRPLSSPGTAGALEELFSFAPQPPRGIQLRARTDVNIDDIQSVRQSLRDVAGNFNNPVDQRWAGHALDRIDDFLARLPQSALVRGNAQAAAGALAEARGNWAAARSLDALGDKLYAADLQTASAHSGTNFDNPVRQKVRSILTNDKQRARYTPEEIQLMERIVEGTAPQNLMRRINKLLPRSGVMGAALHGASIMHFGPAGVIPAMIGETAAGIESQLANKLVRDLQQSIVRRSPLGQQGYQLPPANLPDFAAPVAAGSLSEYLHEKRQTPSAIPLEKRSSLNPDEGRVVSDVDERPIAGQQYAMMNEDDLRNPGQRRPLATPIFGGPGAPPSKPAGQLPPVEPRPTLNYQSAGATRQGSAPAKSAEPTTEAPVRRSLMEGQPAGKMPKRETLADIAARNKDVKGTLNYRSAGGGRSANENELSPSSHQRPIPEEYLQPKTFMQRIFDNTKNMNRDEILQSEPIWGGARQLSESGKMSFRDAFHLLVEQRTGYGLTSQEWVKIAEQAMKYGIR